MRRFLLTAALAAALALPLLADTLVMRDGSRIQGELIAVRNGVIEFEEHRGGVRGRRLQVDRQQIVRIEFDAPSPALRDFAGGRSSGMRERSVIVSAAEPWNDTGIDVRAGQSIQIEATGEVRWGRDRRDGPAGEHNSPSNPGRPMPNRPAAALIGRIGHDSTDYFFIGGEQGPLRVRSSGRLYLGINDDVLTDNSGNFRVVVFY